MPHFYPRSPCGERRRRSVKLFRQNYISIHALLAESDYITIITICIVLRFLSTLSLRRATSLLCYMIHLLSYFYPRSPCGERRYWPCVHVVGRAISIHALLAESDALAPEENPTQKNFYPRSPCGERLLEQSASYNAALENFYPRSPCGERPDTSIIILDEYQFLSTLSLRRATDDLQVPASVSKISIHALLAESDRLIPSLSTMLFDFYPRSPCGERRLPTALRTPHHKFLSTLSLRRATH